MAPSNNSNGTQLTVIDTEHTLKQITATAGDYICGLDLSVLVDADEIELRVYHKPVSGGTERLRWLRSYAHAQEELIVEFPPLAVVADLKYTLTQVAGSVRTFTWWVTALG